MASSNFNMNFDPVVRQQFAEILAVYGLTIPQAFKLFANEVIHTKTIPLSFNWRAEQEKRLELNDVILDILEKNKQEQLQGRSIKYINFNEMMADLVP